MFEFFLVPAIIIFIGIIFILIAAGTKRQGKKKLAVCTAETKGTVVRWLHKKTINDYADSVDDIWFPVYAYDVEGKHYEEKSPVALSERGELYAETVLHYEPGNPTNFYANIGNYGCLILIFRLVGWILILGALVAMGIIYNMES